MDAVISVRGLRKSYGARRGQRPPRRPGGRGTEPGATGSASCLQEYRAPRDITDTIGSPGSIAGLEEQRDSMGRSSRGG